MNKVEMIICLINPSKNGIVFIEDVIMATRNLLGPKTRNEIKCPVCGTLNPNGNKVCRNCGNSLD